MEMRYSTIKPLELMVDSSKCLKNEVGVAYHHQSYAIYYFLKQSIKISIDMNSIRIIIE